MGNEQSSDSPSETANKLTPEVFDETIFNPALKVTWPTEYTLTLETSHTISRSDLEACVELVRLTSVDGYKGSTWGWSSTKKLKEMQEPDMRFLLVRQDSSEADGNKSGELLGFLSFMLTVEDDIEVVYCYEIHLLPQLRGLKLGAKLMQLMERIGQAVGVSKAMLTVFTSNGAARSFYEHIGYEFYDEEAPPPQKRLRSRTTTEAKPTFVILAKDLG